MIRQSQRDLALMLVKPELDAAPVLYAVNDTLVAQSGSYRITAYDTQGNTRPVLEGRFEAAANEATVLPPVSVPNAQELWLLTWETPNGKTHCNHFVTGSRPYSFAAWKTWSTILKTAYEADAND